MLKRRDRKIKKGEIDKAIYELSEYFSKDKAINKYWSYQYHYQETETETDEEREAREKQEFREKRLAQILDK